MFLSQIKAHLNLIVASAVIGVVVAVGLYIMGIKHDLKSTTSDLTELQASYKILESNNKTLLTNVETLQDVNALNSNTINALRDERKQAEEAVASLSRKNLANIEKINDLRQLIDKLSAEPGQDAPIAPVLKRTLQEISKRGSE